MKISQYMTSLYDSCVREPRLIWRYYRPFRLYSGKGKRARNIFMVDGKVGHGGMFDRLKGAITVYALSKVHQKEFKLNFVYPFQLSDYLEPNTYDWRISPDEVCYHYPAARPLFLYGECYHPWRIFKNRRSEAHFYYGYDSLKEINARYKTDFEWGSLYRELFRPTPYLQKYIDGCQQEIGQNYIAVHTRFLNLLGDKVETDINPELTEEKKLLLMNSIGEEIKKISMPYMQKGMQILLASDSMRFIEYMKELIPSIFVIPGTVKHIDTAGHTTDDENIKMFLDYHLISMAKEVYSIVSEGMWASAFPEYAAKIGNIDFKRIVL